jgi:hypothetical protein
MRKTLLFFYLCAALGASEVASIPKNKAIKEAKKAAGELHHMMKSHVKPKLKEKGVYAAVKFCAEESYGRIKELDRKLGEAVSIKRVSLKNRNPDSYPDQSEISIVKAFDLIESSDAYLPAQIVQMVEEGTYKVYFPSAMSSRTCKACHGPKKNMDPKARKFLESKYPHDKAYGFRSGQIRGAVIVTVKTDIEKN